jgi:hypothetical protein
LHSRLSEAIEVLRRTATCFLFALVRRPEYNPVDDSIGVRLQHLKQRTPAADLNVVSMGT